MWDTVSRERNEGQQPEPGCCFLLLFGPEEAESVGALPVLPHLEVEMVSGRVPGGAYIANHLTNTKPLRQEKRLWQSHAHTVWKDRLHRQSAPDCQNCRSSRILVQCNCGQPESVCLPGQEYQCHNGQGCQKRPTPQLSCQAGMPWQWTNHGTVSHGRHSSFCAGSCTAHLYQHGSLLIGKQMMQNIHLIILEC